MILLRYAAPIFLLVGFRYLFDLTFHMLWIISKLNNTLETLVTHDTIINLVRHEGTNAWANCLKKQMRLQFQNTPMNYFNDVSVCFQMLNVPAKYAIVSNLLSKIHL